MRVIFVGTPDYVIPALDALLDADHDVPLVVTPPDRVSGRGGSSEAPPVKLAARERGLPVFQPDSVNDAEAVQRLSEEDPDLLLVASFGKILNRAVLDVAAKAPLNIHPSCLPAYRGPSPVAQAILDGKESTCVSIFEMDEKMDHGPLVAKQRVSIGPDETTGQLRTRLFRRAAKLLPDLLNRYEDGAVDREEQDHERATYTSFFSKEDGRIDWYQPAGVIDRRLRALSPWPGTFSQIEMENRSSPLRVGILEGETLDDDETVEPGTVVDASADGIVVQTGDGQFVIHHIQPENKTAMDVGDFINGYQPQRGDRFFSPECQETAENPS